MNITLRRIAATVIDLIIVFLVAAAWLFVGKTFSYILHASFTLTALYIFSFPVLHAMYYILQEEKSGQTPGKRITKIKVALVSSPTEKGIPFKSAFIRWLLKFPVSIFAPYIFVNGVMTFITKYQRGVHDFAAKTVVISV